MPQNRDEEIRDTIIAVLHKAHRNPRGKYQFVTEPTLTREVKEITLCEREDIIRELRTLQENGYVKRGKKRTQTYQIGVSKIPALTIEYYVLTGKALSELEEPSKYTRKSENIASNSITITDSTINAPLNVNQKSIALSYDSSFDVKSLLELVEKKGNIQESQRKILSSLIQKELPKLLENPEAEKTEQFVEKLKNLGQTWIVPIITQLAASYFSHKLGI